MIIKILYTSIITIVLGFNSITNSYENELAFLDESKTIKELKENIDILDKTNINLSNELKVLNADYKLKTFLRQDLLAVEIKKIREIVYEYNKNKGELELILIKKAQELFSIINEKKLLLEEKRKLYSSLIPYINTNFRKQYLEYIKGDAKIFNEQNNVTTDIIGKKEILNNKVETIETKIREHKNFINENIKKVIETRLDAKITNLNKNERFKILNTESKIKVLDKTIRKVKIKLQNLENTRIKTYTGVILRSDISILDKKIQTYYIAVNKLEVFRNSLK